MTTTPQPTAPEMARFEELADAFDLALTAYVSAKRWASDKQLEDLAAKVNAARANQREYAASLVADKRRVDWLEKEMVREQERIELAAALSLPYTPTGTEVSLFRRNLPITRAALDAAMQGGGT